MKSDHIQPMVRALSEIVSRRAALSGGAAVVIAALRGREEAAAKKRKKRKCKTGTKKCGKQCIPVASCCTNSECGAGRVCQGGSCFCAPGTKECMADAGCLPQHWCCAHSDCRSRGERWECRGSDGVCVCEAGFKECRGECILDHLCCENADCGTGSGQLCENRNCTCPSGKIYCNGECLNGVCCGDYHCRFNERCCSGTCAQCCGNNDCPHGFICDQGRCVYGQGSCAAGANACQESSLTCGSGPTCHCLQSLTGETRCADIAHSGACNCTSDADCRAAHPDRLGVFCARGGGPNCGCAGDTGFCASACLL